MRMPAKIFGVIRQMSIQADYNSSAAMAKHNRGVVFHVSLLYNLLLKHEQRRPWWSHIEPKLILGALPLQDKNHLDQLVQTEGVKAIVTMNQPVELLPNFLSTPVSPAEWEGVQVVQCFGSTGDFSPPTLVTIERCVEFIHEQVDVQQHTTYVHCKAGRGRSTVVVVAFLIQYRSLTLDEAFQFVKTKRPHVSLHPKQRQILHEFSEKYSSSSPAGLTSLQENGSPSK
ncbi:Phosphatidylglycerophosphatase and protein-tyrosine phosphatase 1 [Phytophthora citrophthora]|uniref:Phosphatidylglycerophosphatase and protein-tyrosine phosphatase 1 n=1 Tax=Phytophthora citrophthora TaxID=4793 RepID=A0AAD9G2W5_9STRA|nr:Phosphatidylglycerophosphatase and protein-tyrosine phosphatase 1 [Phytophthora citrophthora]